MLDLVGQKNTDQFSKLLARAFVKSKGKITKCLFKSIIEFGEVESKSCYQSCYSFACGYFRYRFSQNSELTFFHDFCQQVHKVVYRIDSEVDPIKLKLKKCIDKSGNYCTCKDVHLFRLRHAEAVHLRVCLKAYEYTCKEVCDISDNCLVVLSNTIES